MRDLSVSDLVEIWVRQAVKVNRVEIDKQPARSVSLATVLGLTGGLACSWPR